MDDETPPTLRGEEVTASSATRLFRWHKDILKGNVRTFFFFLD